MALERVKVPAPALVNVTPDPAMMPLIVDAPPLVMLMALLLASVMAAALSPLVLMVRPVNGALLPRAPVIVVLPVPLALIVSVLAPLILSPKATLPLLLVVSVLSAVKVTAPL